MAFKTCAGLMATALGLFGASTAMGQAPAAIPGDWPNLGAFNNRQGRNGDPRTYTSGLTDLRWVAPSAIATRNPIELDNTDLLDTTNTGIFAGGPYDPPVGGFVSPPFPGFAVWRTPTNLSKEASDPRVFARRTRSAPTDRRERTPRYSYATCTPSLNRSDPTRATNAANLKYYEWNVRPVAGPERTYAVYAYLPTGPTDVSNVAAPLDRRFPQRYFVYEIRFGLDLHSDANPRTGAPDGIPDGRYVDVVDTEVSGRGFVRLGGGGFQNQTAFPVTGEGNSFIRVRLYNTVPRNADNSLAIEDSRANMTDAEEEALAARRLVYADSILARPELGTFVASPTVSTLTSTPVNDWRIAAARNEYTGSIVDGVFDQTQSGVVTMYEGNTALWTDPVTPLVNWRYSVVEESANANTTDNTAATFSSGWDPASTANPRHIGADYRTANVVTVAPATATAEYKPTLDDGTYDLYAYVGGNKTTPPTETYARGAQYVVYEGADAVLTGTIDQSLPSGWVRLGARRYVNDATNGQPLKVVVTNLSTVAGDVGRKVYADAIRFVSASNIGISSTPVHATVGIRKTLNGPLEQTKVVIVADESGKIHCLDLAGNPDGSTIEYWSYPSTPNYQDANWRDPNLSEPVAGSSGIDGTINPAINPARDNAPTATMPSAFDLSTAAVANVGGTDVLYIGATNGRVYCIEMGGRGDFNATTRVVGSTKRQWTYPNDYDPTDPAAPIGTSALGAFRGSVLFANSAQGAPGDTLYVPARQGRIIALDAGIGNARRQTTVRWQYPDADQPTLPTISMTPTLFKPATATNATLFFGTLRDLADDGPGQYLALDAASGKAVWRINGLALDADADGAPNPGDTASTIRFVDDSLGSFVAGSVAVPGTVLDSSATSTRPDTIYAINDNLSLYARRVTDGALIYATEPRDLLTLCDTNLTFTFASVFERTGTARQLFPVILIPGTNNQFTFAFSRLEDSNVSNGYLADYRTTRGGDLRSLAAANNFLFAADNEGALYAYDNLGALGNNIAIGLDTGSSRGVPPNDPSGRPFRHLKIRLVDRATYLQLKEVDENGRGPLTYQEAVVNAPGPGGNPYAFEWGEQAYVLVYGFPYTLTNQASPPVAVPASTVTITLSLEGKTAQPKTVEAREFRDPASAPVLDENPNGITPGNQTGYAIVSFTFMNSGSTALPPGNGQITATITTAAAGSDANPVPVPISPDLRDPLTVALFRLANPLRLEVVSQPGNNEVKGYGFGNDAAYNAANNANAMNGSPDFSDPADATAVESQLLASAGLGNHGATATAQFYVSDRSLMVLQNGVGITNVRMTRTNAQRQGGAAGLWNPLSQSLYPGFEDRPVNFPNTSLDYPDIGREQVRAVKDPTGNPENPLLSAVGLKPPTSIRAATRGQVLQLEDLDDGTTTHNARAIQRTRFDLPIDIPRYQPPVNTRALTVGAGTQDLPRDLLHLKRNSAGSSNLPQGYFGRAQVYVDSTPDQKLTVEGTRETYRAFNYSVGVLPQTSIQTGTPTVDLGGLAAGTGYAPANPFAAGADSGIAGPRGPFNPWGLRTNVTDPDWSGVYKPISVRNDGNVNLLDLRVAKAVNDTGVDRPWALATEDNDPLAWMSAILRGPGGVPAPGDLWSNIDTTFAPVNRFGGGNLVILPKPRVTDRVPTELLANPYPRANPNVAIGAGGAVVPVGTLGSVLVDGSPTYRINTSVPSVAPLVGVSVPIGFPVGNYSTLIRVVENSIGGDNDVLNFVNPRYEAYSDPITLTYKVRETRMTNRTTPRTAPVLDDPNLLPGAYPGSPQVGPDAFKARASFQNSAPAAMRDINGSLIVAWASDRLNAAGAAAVPVGVNPTLIYLGTLDNRATFSDTGTGAPAGNAPLWDLSQFAGAGDQWFRKLANGYPTNGATLFDAASADVVASTMRFGSPSFPARGSMDPLVMGPTLAANSLGNPLMAFVGEAQVSTGTGRLAKSKVFVTPISVDAGGVMSVPGAPIATLSDPLTAKGKPSVLQLKTGALVFYSETSAGQSGITVDRLRSGGGFAAPVGLNFGDGFSSVFSPSATARRYLGPPIDGISNRFVELSFAGKLRGRPNAEAYIGRLRLDTAVDGADPTSLQLVDAKRQSAETERAGTPFILLPQQENERLVDDGNGVYRARGVGWIRQSPATGGAAIRLVQYVNGAPPTDLFASTGTVERQSGLIAYDSRLGGKVYVDPELGTVKFVGATPNRNAELRLTYTPTFLRVTPGGTAAYSSVNGMFDDRFVSEYSYWFKNSGAAYSGFGDVIPDDAVRNDRYFFAYGRGAAGGGVTARPYSTSMRIGVRLPTRIATDGNGKVVGIRVTNNLRPYQVDPANGRVYFQAEDENRLVNIEYEGVNEANNGTQKFVLPPTRPSFVLERAETLLPVDEAANDSALTAFLDPFNYLSATNNPKERPPLVWLFYVSTRAGGPDVYFQTIAPRFLPFSK